MKPRHLEGAGPNAAMGFASLTLDLGVEGMRRSSSSGRVTATPVFRLSPATSAISLAAQRPRLSGSASRQAIFSRWRLRAMPWRQPHKATPAFPASRSGPGRSRRRRDRCTKQKLIAGGSLLVRFIESVNYLANRCASVSESYPARGGGCSYPDPRPMGRVGPRCRVDAGPSGNRYSECALCRGGRSGIRWRNSAALWAALPDIAASLSKPLFER